MVKLGRRAYKSHRTFDTNKKPANVGLSILEPSVDIAQDYQDLDAVVEEMQKASAEADDSSPERMGWLEEICSLLYEGKGQQAAEVS